MPLRHHRCSVLLPALALLLHSGCRIDPPGNSDRPAEQRPLFRFAVVGDTQGQHLFEQIIEQVNRHGASHLIVPGDLVDTGGTPEERFGSWQSWIGQARAFGPGLERILMAPGNHDLPSGGDERWRRTFSRTPGGAPWLPDSQEVQGRRGLDQMDYFVDVAGLRFVSLTTDTEHHGPAVLGQQTLDWLFAVLEDSESSAAVRHVFVFTHHPVTFDSHYETIGGTPGAWWTGMMERSSKIRALFTGHWHLFQPSRPDPRHPGTWEVVTGTGGGVLEGRRAQSEHGFLLVDLLASGAIEARFLGDRDGAADGWLFDDELDRLTLFDPGPATDKDRSNRVAAHYGFEHGRILLDSAAGGRARRIHGRLVGDASRAPGRTGAALRVSGKGHAEASAIGDYELAILGDLTIDLDLWLDQPPGPDGATLVEYSAAGPHPPADSEAVNTAYSLRLARDGTLTLGWEAGRGEEVAVASSSPWSMSGHRWTHLRCTRDATDRHVRFWVDGEPLGRPVPFDRLPTGGGAGFLHIGRGADRRTGFTGWIDELVICRALLPADERIEPDVPRGDFDADLGLSHADLRAFAKPFSERSPAADIDGDGEVDLTDFMVLQAGIVDLPEPPGTTDFALDSGIDGLTLESLGGRFGQSTYAFSNNHGLRLSGADEKLGEQYLIEMEVAFTRFGNGRWGKLLDFKNRSADTGLYIRSRDGRAYLEFFPDRGSGSAELSAGRFHRIRVTRDASSERFEVWLDGQHQFGFDDVRAEAVFRDLHLLCDDRGQEAAAGVLHRLRLARADDPASGAAGSEPRTALHLPFIQIAEDRTVRLVNHSPDPFACLAIGLHAPGGGLTSFYTGWHTLSQGTELLIFWPGTARPLSLAPGSTLDLARAGSRTDRLDAEFVDPLAGEKRQLPIIRGTD